MSNVLVWDERGFIRHQYIGDQSVQLVANDIARIENIVAELRTRKQPVKLLVDVSEIGKTTDAMRRISIDSAKRLKYDKVAVVGKGVFFKYLTKFVALEFKAYSEIRYFDSKVEAETWLTQI